MSKRPTNKRYGTLPIPATGKRGLPRAPIFLLAVAVPVALGFWWWNSNLAHNPPEVKALTGAKVANPAAAAITSQFQRLQGQWRRPDGGYTLAIKNIADNGTMDAAYFNPSPIHVARAEASRNGDAMKVFVELRDVNFPVRPTR